MELVDLLLETSAADREHLLANLEHGDRPELPRDLEFMLYAATEERAVLVCDFVTDNGYGRPSFDLVDAEDGPASWRVTVTIQAPATAEVVCALSGLMACLSQVFDLDYDGWGSEIRTDD